MVKHKGIRVGNRKKATPPKQPYAVNYSLFKNLAFFLPFLSIAIKVILGNNFVTEKEVLEVAFWGSVLVTLAALCLFYALASLNLLYPKPNFSSDSALWKSVKLLGYGLSLYCIIWPCLSSSAPMLFTLSSNTVEEKLVIVEKSTRTTTRGCKWFIRGKGSSQHFMHCISYEEYFYLPQGPVLVSIDVAHSQFGYFVVDYNHLVGTIESK
ncbi:hypothetical protein [Marinomonas fungiae]|uniref:hypothetical protein n=1 Tax=Marinomonas fungiae TaxID=1137284 RepID=UPI003A9338BC